MYHCLDSLQYREFYLTKGGWHRLDNIASIQFFINLCVYWMDNETDIGSVSSKDTHLCFVGLFLILIMQEKHPWDLLNTLVPILLYFLMLILKLSFLGGAKLNLYMLKRALISMLVAFICFYKGLDNANDYLGIWHGGWHCFLSLSGYYSW